MTQRSDSNWPAAFAIVGLFAMLAAIKAFGT